MKKQLISYFLIILVQIIVQAIAPLPTFSVYGFTKAKAMKIDRDYFRVSNDTCWLNY